jgi:hypothetical protein
VHLRHHLPVRDPGKEDPGPDNVVEARPELLQSLLHDLEAAPRLRGRVARANRLAVLADRRRAGNRDDLTYPDRP